MTKVADDEEGHAVLDEHELAADKADAAIDPRVSDARARWRNAYDALLAAMNRGQAQGVLPPTKPRFARNTLAVGLLRQWRETRDVARADQLLRALELAAADLEARREMLEVVLATIGGRAS